MPQQTKKQNSFPLSSDGEWYTDGPVVVGKYTQSRQRLLRAKIVKSDYGKHYKGSLLPCTGEGGVGYKHQGIRNFKTKK